MESYLLKDASLKTQIFNSSTFEDIINSIGTSNTGISTRSCKCQRENTECICNVENNETCTCMSVECTSCNTCECSKQGGECTEGCQRYCQCSTQSNETCGTYCNTGCQVECDSSCEDGCNVGCEVCESCDTCQCSGQNNQCTCNNQGCQSCDTCQATCELNCEKCEACQSECQLYCEVNCEVACQKCNSCQSSCEKGKQNLTTHIGSVNTGSTLKSRVSTSNYTSLASYINKALDACQYSDTKLSESVTLKDVIVDDSLFDKIKEYVNKIASTTLDTGIAQNSKINVSNMSKIESTLNSSKIPNTVPCCEDTSWQNCVSMQSGCKRKQNA